MLAINAVNGTSRTFSQYSEKASTMAFSLFKAHIIAFTLKIRHLHWDASPQSYSLTGSFKYLAFLFSNQLVINIADKHPNFRQWLTPNIAKFLRNFVDSSISYWPQSRRIWSEDAVAAAAAGCPNKTNYRRVWTNFEDNNSNFRASGLGSAGRPAAVLHLFICFATNWVLCSVFSVECKVQTILTSI